MLLSVDILNRLTQNQCLEAPVELLLERAPPATVTETSVLPLAVGLVLTVAPLATGARTKLPKVEGT